MVDSIAIENLSASELLSGGLSFLYIIISIIVGILFFRKYTNIEHRSEYISLGLTYIFLSSGWWGSGFQFLSILIFSAKLPDPVYLLLGNFFFNMAMITFIHALCKILLPKGTKILTIVTAIIIAPLEVLMIHFAINEPFMMGTVEDTFQASTSDFINDYMLIPTGLGFLMGLYLAIKSMRTKNPRIRYRGVFLFGAFLVFGIAVFTDSRLGSDLVLIIAVRSILILSAIFFYMGFFLPKFVENKIFKKDESFSKKN